MSVPLHDLGRVRQMKVNPASGYPPHAYSTMCDERGCVDVEEETGPMYRNAEQNEILGTFLDRLAVPTGDGGRKRAAGTKVHWKVDTSHKLKMLGHLIRWLCGEKVDADSGAHPLDHVAWRALAIAHQETQETADEQ